MPVGVPNGQPAQAGLACGDAFLGRREQLNREAVELFTSREEAEAIVQAWDRDEPEQAGALRVEAVAFRTGTAN